MNRLTGLPTLPSESYVQTTYAKDPKHHKLVSLAILAQLTHALDTS